MNNKKKKSLNLPKTLIHIPNKDKAWHEKWTEGDDELNFPHPFTCLLLGKPNRGKTNIIKNIIIRQNKPFKNIYLLHCGLDLTHEYDEIDTIDLKEIPSPFSDIINDKEKNLFILEDLEFKNMASKEQKSRMNRLYGYVSTHRNCSIISSGQDFFDLPACVRRMSKIFIIWKVDDIDSLETIRRRVDIKKADWAFIFDHYIRNPHDSLWIDMTKNSPYKLRLNGYKILEKK